MSRHAPRVRRLSGNSRLLRLESLENRFLLSHPTVTAVNLSSTAWDANFVSHLESSGLGVGGYAIPVGSANQLRTVPWLNANQVRITFSEEVVIQASDLSISGANNTAYAFSDFSYDLETSTAVWTVATSLAADKLLLDLDADGLDPICAAALGEVLDGAWTDCQSTFNSGNGQGGTDFQFRINILPGDTNANAAVDLADAALAYNQIGKTPGQSGYDIRYDADGSGVITLDDYNAIQSKFGGVLPSGDPVGMTNDAPTTCNLSNVNVAAGRADYLLSLMDFFGDAETAPENLVYSIVQNSNPSLFDSLGISSGELTLDFASAITGEAAVTVRATDAAGLFVDASLLVDVSSAPVVYDFYCIQEPGGYWTLTGFVSDYDDDVAGYQVIFGGVLEQYNLTATVEVDGLFCITVELPGLEMGTATAQTMDIHGIMSNLAQDWVMV
jgi:hypothetical protein